jgi:hypothetical protein
LRTAARAQTLSKQCSVSRSLLSLLRERLRTGNPKMDAERNSVMLDFLRKRIFCYKWIYSFAKVVLGKQKLCLLKTGGHEPKKLRA